MEKEEKTPIEETVKEPEKVGETEVTPPPVPEPDKTDDDLRSTVNELKETVQSLVTTVASIAPVEPDSKPTKRPWTHWGGR